MAVIGIDLGTTNSLAAYWKDGEVRLIPMNDGPEGTWSGESGGDFGAGHRSGDGPEGTWSGESEEGFGAEHRSGDGPEDFAWEYSGAHRETEAEVLLPSVAGYVEGEGFLVGAAAKERLITHPEDTAASFKRFMGTAKEYGLGGKAYTPMELSAMVLERIRKNAEFFLKEEIQEAVITVPAYFNDKQRSDTKKAAQVAGLKVERLINEPSAAALAYRMEYGQEDKTLLVFDFGGGTLDLSYVECFDNVIEITAVAGDNHLGGDDVDEAISDYFCRENGMKASELTAGERAGLRKLAERAKWDMALEKEILMELEIGGKHCSAPLNQEILFSVCMPLFGKIRQLFVHLLEDAGSRISAIDDLIMVGGSSKLNVVKRFLTELLGKEPIVLGETDRVVAYGAGIYAGIRQRREEIKDLLLTDVCPFTLGIGVNNRANRNKNILSPMIERNSTLPASHKGRFVTTCDYQNEIRVQIYQGEEYYVDDDVFLGEVTIEVVPKPAGEAWVDVQFTYDINGILHVAVTNELGERRQVLLANQTLSEAELQQYVREMEKIMLPPIQQPRNQEMLARFLEYYENSTGQRRERIAFMTSQIVMGLNSGRKKAVKNAEKTGRLWLETLEREKDMAEEFLFDGELKHAWELDEDPEELESDGELKEDLEEK
ncbi:MAG: Hsp70 family protein [Lachnospiraceae bacterium]|jgi:molecular chaperone HscC|nr:Hsp70 family protein [Lachnospiraceae bacterium]